MGEKERGKRGKEARREELKKRMRHPYITGQELSAGMGGRQREGAADAEQEKEEEDAEEPGGAVGDSG